MSDDIRQQMLDAMAERWSAKTTHNPEWSRLHPKTRTEYSYLDEPPVQPYIDRIPEAMREDVCMAVFTAEDGYGSIRALTYAEVVDLLLEKFEVTPKTRLER